MATPASSYPAGGPDAPHKTRPIAIYLFSLALVALVPAFVFSAILLQRNNEAQERVVQTLISGTARSIVQAVEREITANVTTLKILATTPSLLNGDYRAFYDQVKLALVGSDSFIYILDQNYNSVLSTRGAYDAPAVRSNDPESAQRALQTHDTVISDLVFGKVSQRWVFNILQPVFPAGGDPLVIGLSRNASDLAAALLVNKLPDGWNVAMIDDNRTIIAGSAGAGVIGDQFDLADPDTLASAPGLVIATIAGESYSTMVRRSALTGWTLVAWAPRSVIAKPLMDAVLSLAVGGILLAALVILVVYWVTLQIGRSVRGLENDARRLGAGQPIPARNYPITEIATISSAIEDASRHRQAAETEVRFLMRELAHRSKNQMTVIAAMAKQTARGADSVPEFVQSFEKRIFGLARSTDLLLIHGVIGVDLRELLTQQIDPFCPVGGGRVTIAGPAMRLNTQAAQILGMAAHELATNAVKYGAFSTDKGMLSLTWTREGQTLDLVWRETATELAERKERRGFGTTVLENMVGRSLGAKVDNIMHPDGIEWHFAIPVVGLDPAMAPDAHPEGDP